MHSHHYFISVLCLTIVCVSQPVLADTATPRIDERQELQQHRIDQGRASGELTPGEARHLSAQQNRIERAEVRAKADNNVTRKERLHLKQRQRQANRAVFRAKHNRFNQ